MEWRTSKLQLQFQLQSQIHSKFNHSKLKLVMPLSFKKYLSAKSKYKGGKSKNEVEYEGRLHKLSSNENLFGPSLMAVAAIKNNLIESMNILQELI